MSHEEAQRTSAPVSSPASSIYTRQSSGLIRSVSWTKSVLLNVTNIGVIFGILTITQVPAAFPDADPVLMAIITTLVCLLPALLYGMWTAIIPRSGADYVWNSRVFSPIVGFSTSFLAVIWFVLVNGYLAYLLGSESIPTAMQIFGAATDNPGLAEFGTSLTDPNVTFVIGALALLFGLGVAALGMRRGATVILVILAVELIGLVVGVAVLLAHTQADFQSAVSAYGTAYDSYLTQANSAGYGASTSGYTLAATLLAMPPLYLGLGYAVAGSYAGGELRGARKSGMWGPAVAVIIAGVAIVGSFMAASHTLGFKFVGAATFLFNNGSAAYTLPAGANYFSFVSLLNDSPVVAAILGITYIFAPLASICVVSLYCTRSVFAWSFDRILPDKLATVNPRTGVPVPALVFVFLVGLVYLLAIRIFGTTTLETLGATVAGSSVAFMLAALGAVVLPFWRRTRSIYELSPFRGKFLGIPILSIVGAAAFIVYAFMFIAALTQDAIGANNPRALIAQAIVLGLALLVFPLSSFFNKRRGVDLRLLGKELPPD